MSDCTVWIDIDGDSQRFEPGDQIVGTVFTRVDRACDQATVHIQRQWTVGGRAADQSGGADRILLADGPCRRGHTHAYPFIFDVPPGPYSYHGRLIEVGWFLRAELHVGGTEADTDESRLDIRPRGDESEFIIGDPPGSTDVSVRALTPPRRTWWFLGSLLLILVGSGLLYPHVAALPGATWTTLLSGLGCLMLGGWSSYKLFRRQRNTGQSASFEPSSTDYQVEPGDSVSFIVELQPNFKSAPQAVTADLKGYERVWPAGADAEHPVVYRFHDEPIPIEVPEDVDPADDRHKSYRVSFRVPDHAPFSFVCANASINWAIEVHVDVGSWPDWRREFPVVVRPCVGSAPVSDMSQSSTRSRSARGRGQ